MTRGEIWWTDLPPPRGSAPGFRRLAVIISSDPFNRSRIATVVVAIVTSNIELARSRGNLFVKKRKGGLARDSVINVTALLTIDKNSLVERCGSLTFEQLRSVDEGLRLVLAL